MHFVLYVFFLYFYQVFFNHLVSMHIIILFFISCLFFVYIWSTRTSIWPLFLRRLLMPWWWESKTRFFSLSLSSCLLLKDSSRFQNQPVGKMLYLCMTVGVWWKITSLSHGTIEWNLPKSFQLLLWLIIFESK